MIATLTELRKEETFEFIGTQGNRLMEGIRKALEDAGVPARVGGFPSIFHVGFGVESPITDYRSSLQADRARYVKFAEALLHRGVRALERGAWSVSAAHTDDVVDATIEAVAEVAKEI